MTSTEKLVSLGSESLGAELGSAPPLFENYACGRELFEMLKLKNGFYAFEQALHVFPFGFDVTGTMTLEEWNSRTLWRNAYDDLTEGMLFLGRTFLAISSAFLIRRQVSFVLILSEANLHSWRSQLTHGQIRSCRTTEWQPDGLLHVNGKSKMAPWNLEQGFSPKSPLFMAGRLQQTIFGRETPLKGCYLKQR